MLCTICCAPYAVHHMLCTIYAVPHMMCTIYAVHHICCALAHGSYRTGACFDCVVAENIFNGSFAADWGRNPHVLFGGWQPNLQVEWNDNTVVGEKSAVRTTTL
jgi:hypothetical protein